MLDEHENNFDHAARVAHKLLGASAFTTYIRLEPTPQEREYALAAAACPCSTCDFRAPCATVGADHCPEWRQYVGLLPLVPVKPKPQPKPVKVEKAKQERPTMAKPEMQSIAARLPVPIVLQLKELARSEQRTDAGMTAILVKEALAARGVTPSSTAQKPL